jgi:hypothetical protein
MKKNNLVRTSRHKDEWFFSPRQEFTVHKDLQDEEFDKMPIREGAGKLSYNHAYATNVLDRWFRSHLGKPWNEVQALLKQKLPNDYHYRIACDAVRKSIVIDGVTYINRHNWFGGNMQPVEESGFFRDEFYVDQKGILREAKRRKYVPRPAPVRVAFSPDGYVWFKRNNIVYKAVRADATSYNPLYSRPQNRWANKYNTYYSYGVLTYWDGSDRKQIKSPSIKQASHKDLNHYADIISKLNEEVIQNTPD